MSKSDGPKLVTASFSFKGKNNDELCFKKGDIITITQTDDGGWWEGTLNEKTGWFPSNYVKEYKAPGTSLQSLSFSDSDSGSVLTKVSPEKSSPDSPIHQILNRDIVLKDIVDSECANVAELKGLIRNFLQPLQTAEILKREEYKQLIGNIHEVLEIHQRLLVMSSLSLSQGLEARVGNVFLKLAPKMKSVHTTYCNSHPQAVCILDRFSDELNEFMESNGAISPGILVLTTGLSKPFRRLDKYSAMLQELERHTEKDNPDRGDTQRSVSVYRDIADRCAAIRKQRELALQILTSGIKGWEGEELNNLGDIIHVGPVILLSGVDKRDRYFVLFLSTLLVLSTSTRMSSFVYEGKLPLTAINVVVIEQTDEIKNAFEISGPMIESMKVLCPSREERQHWIELLSQDQIASRSSNISPSPTSVSHVSCCTHPPYTRLSRYFARLVRKRIIHPELLKRLLYFQYIFRPDLKSVKMRKCYLVTYTLFPSKSFISSDDEDVSTKISSAHPSCDRNELQPLRKSSTLKLDVRYVLDDKSYSCQRDSSNRDLRIPPSTSTSMGVFSSKPPITMPEVLSHSLPPQISSSGCCIIPNFDSVQYRELRSGEAKIDLSNICNVEEDSKNWRSLGQQRQGKVQQHNSVRLRPTTSPRSSDSGMADSFQYHSAELGSCYAKFCRSAGVQSESENDENKFENQCICSSPFGSTPRQSSSSESSTSASKSLLSSRLGNNNESNGENNNNEDVRLPSEELLSDFEEEENSDDEDLENCTCELNKRERNLRQLTLKQHRHLSQPLPECAFSSKPSKRQGRRPLGTLRVYKEEDEPECSTGAGGSGQVFTSGLYAHWWLKKTIPMTDQVNQSDFEASCSSDGTVLVPRD